MMGSYSREINVQNALEYSYCSGILLAKWKCIYESFLSEHTQSIDFIGSGKADTSFNYAY